MLLKPDKKILTVRTSKSRFTSSLGRFQRVQMSKSGSLSFPIPGSWTTEKQLPWMPARHKHKKVTGSLGNHNRAQVPVSLRICPNCTKSCTGTGFKQSEIWWVSRCQHQSVLKTFYVSVFVLRRNSIRTKGILPYISVCHRRTDQRTEIDCCLGHLTDVIMCKQNYMLGSMEVPSSQS